MRGSSVWLLPTTIITLVGSLGNGFVDGKARLITSARDKMPLEVTPFFPRLSRVTLGESPETTAASHQGANNN